MKRVNTNPFKYILCFSLLFLFLFRMYAEPADLPGQPSNFAEKPAGSPGGAVSPALVFHDLGWNILKSVTYNYGLNFAGAGLGTWGFIGTGLDWKWRNVAYNNAWLVNLGLPLQFAGYLVPILTPLSVYLAGRFYSDEKMQITAVALFQAFLVTQTFHLPLKIITGRSMPGILSGVFFEPNNTRLDRKDDFSGEFNWFAFDLWDGWPSGHTACAFSAAAVISEMYPDKTLLKIGMYAYAFAMGFCVSVNTHWASDSIAGALIGYAAGRTVGKSFRQLSGKTESADNISPYFTGNSAGVIIRM